MELGSAEDVPVIVVGGAAALCADALPGASAVHRPEHADVANAIGAAIPQACLSTYLPLSRRRVPGLFPCCAQHRAIKMQQPCVYRHELKGYAERVQF